MNRTEFSKLNAEAQAEELANLGYSAEEIEGAANAKGRQDLFNAKVEAEEPQKKSEPKKAKASEKKEEVKPSKSDECQFVVAPLAPRIKHNGGDYIEGDVIETETPEELEHLVKKGYVVSKATIKEKGEYQAFDEAKIKQGYRIRSGREVDTPNNEGRLNDEGDSAEIDKPRKRR